VLQEDAADQPGNLNGAPATRQPMLAEVTRCQEAIQQTLMALRAGSTRREVERRGVLGELLDHLATMARLLPVDDDRVDGGLKQRIRGSLERIERLLPVDTKASLDRETARELPHELHCMLLEVAADTRRLDYLLARLQEEQRQEQLGVSTLRWSELLDPDELSDLRDALAQPARGSSDADPGQLARAVEMLATLYQARNRAEREQRAHDRIRDARLQWVTRWLLLLLVPAAALLVVAFSLASSSSQVNWLQDAVRIALVIMVGGLGSALSGTRRLLGVALLRGQLDRFQAAFRAQVLVGGTLGLVALLLYEVGSLPTFRAAGRIPDVVPLAIYAFLAGFSEPFVLGVVQGLIGGRSAPALPSRQSDEAAHPKR
jgi:hypothetical protein